MHAFPEPVEWKFNPSDYERSRGRFWRCPVRLVTDRTWARLWRPGGRARGGGAAGSLLPVLALHAYPIREGAGAGWTAWVRLSRRRMARLAGLDKDTATAALRTLVDEGVVETQKRRVAAADRRTATWFRLHERVYPAAGEPYVLFPAEAAYSGFWAGLPGAAFRQVLVAWAAVPPREACTGQKLAAVEGALGEASGMGRTAVRRAAAAVLAWRGAKGARLVVRRMYRPEAAPKPGSPGAAGSGSSALQERQVIRLAPRWAVVSAARASGAMVVVAGPKPPKPPMPPPATVDAALPPVAGEETFEARKAWWIRRHLPRWAARHLWRNHEPAREVVFVDCDPGGVEGELPMGLAVACTLAKRVRGQGGRAGQALRVVAVEPDFGRREALRRAAVRARVDLTLFAGTAEEYLLGARGVEGHGGVRPAGPALYFLGSAEAPRVCGKQLRQVTGDGSEAVALTRTGAQDEEQAHLWTAVTQAAPAGSCVAELARDALRHGARRVLAVPLRSPRGEAAGSIVHLAGTSPATVAFKGAVTARNGWDAGAFSAVPWVDAAAAADLVVRRFAGRRIRWSGRADDGPAWDRVRTFLLSDTALLATDCARVRQELVWRGLRIEARPDVFAFPARVAPR